MTTTTASLQHITIGPGAEAVPYYRLGSGQPLLYLHGITGMAGEQRVLDLLAEQFDVIAPYHPGWGPASGLENHDGALDLVLHYSDFLDALGIERALVAGHSIGAWMAAEFAAVMGHRVRALVLAMPVGIWDDGIQGEDPFAQPPMSATAVLLADPSRRELLAAGSNGASDPGDAYLTEMRNLKASAKYLWPIPDTGIARRLDRITVPTLVLVAGKDRFVPPEYGELWRVGIPGSTLATLPDAGHLGTIDDPDGFAAAITAFLAQQV